MRVSRAAKLAAESSQKDGGRSASSTQSAYISYETAAAILEVFDRHGVAYVVIGGLAAALWASEPPRTSDVDITPATDEENRNRIASALIELGAYRLLEDEPGFGVLRRVPGGALITDHGLLDIGYVPEGTGGYEDLASRASRFPLGETMSVLVADVADLVASKEASGRAKDICQLPDLRRLLARVRHSEENS